MIEIKRILCPTDFSEFSQHALEQAVAIARWYGSEITALHVFGISVTAPALTADGGIIALDRTSLMAGFQRELEKDLEQFVAPVASAGVTIRRSIVEGEIVRTIVTQASALPADLVVMGTHGRSGFERLLLGSVAERVLRKAPCPVLTVPRRAPDTKLRFKHVLCPIDFSDSSRAALKLALSLAQEADARLVVAHVVELLSDGEIREYRMFTDPGYRENFERAAREQIAAAIPDAARTFCAIDEVVVIGKAYKEILRLAETREADLIVIGVHGRGAADLMLFGSTTQHVVRQATCPVLTLRHSA